MPFLILLVVASVGFALLWHCYHANKLPQVENVELLRKDCAMLYQQFPVTEETNGVAKYGRSYEYHIFRKISQENWPLSILALKPFEVERDVFGVSIWIKNNNPSMAISSDEDNWIAKGYFVSCSYRFSPRIGPHNHEKSGRFVFSPIEINGVYEFVTPARVN